MLMQVNQLIGGIILDAGILCLLILSIRDALTEWRLSIRNKVLFVWVWLMMLGFLWVGTSLIFGAI